MNRIEGLLINGGIGDFLALDGFLPLHIKKSLKKIYYTTDCFKGVQELIDVSEEYPQVEHIQLWENLFYLHKDHLKTMLLKDKKLTKELLYVLNSSFDLSIAGMYQNCKDYYGCWYADNKLAETRDLPEKFIVVCPYSHHDDTKKERLLCAEEWEKIHSLGLNIVVVGIGDIKVPEYCINLMNKTSFLEAMEIVKKAEKYWGVDSSLATFAAKVKTKENLRVRTVNSWCRKIKGIYYAPQKDFEFLVNKL